MRCSLCGGEMAEKIGTHHMTESGLDNVYLVGARMWDCPCGENVVEIGPLAQITKAIATALLNKPALLTGPEIRFLRKSLGFKQEKLAQIMGVDNVAVSRWESATRKITPGHDRELRLIYATLKGIGAKELVKAQFPAIRPEVQPLDRLEIQAA